MPHVRIRQFSVLAALLGAPIALTLATAMPAAAQNWPQFRGSRHAGSVATSATSYSFSRNEYSTGRSRFCPRRPIGRFYCECALTD